MAIGLSSALLFGQTELARLPDAPSAVQQRFEGIRRNPSPKRVPASQIYPVPIYAVKRVTSIPTYSPMTRQEKFEYFLDGAKSPYTFGSAAVSAASWHAYGNPPYGTGWDGYGKSFGAALAQRELGFFLQRFAMPAMFHEDPRYFAAPTTDNTFQRGIYAASRLFITQADDGTQKFNCSYVIGGLSASLIGNSYIRQRNYGDVTRDFFINMGSDAAYNIAREFWPDMRDKFPTKALRKLGDILIGPHGLPNPNKK